MSVPGIDWADVEADQIPDEPQVAATRQPDPEPPGLPTWGHLDPAAASERERVLRHPEIAARLCERPLSYSRPENWNGYVPPAMWRERSNDSPQRAALLSIITAAVAADKAAET